MVSPAPPAPTRIPSLDGIRALSIALVIFSHLSSGAGVPGWMAAVTHAFGLGRMGVAVFFVLSGFLITTLLLDEHAREGRVRLGRFYLRRTLRIFPPFYVYCAVLALLARVGAVRLLPGDLLHAMTYTMNFQGDRSWYVARVWSLTIEEQFYLLWPLLLLAAGRVRAGVLACAVVVLGPEMHLAAYLWSTPATRGNLPVALLSNVDLLAAGAALACFRMAMHAQGWYGRALDSRWFAAVPPVAFVAWNGLGGHWGVGLVTSTVAVIAIAVCVDWSILHAAGRTGRVLNSRPLVWVGQLSYSLYLWQQMFTGREAAGQGWLSDTVVSRLPLNLAAMLGAAVLSFYLVERPSLTLRRVLEQRWFGGARRDGSPALSAFVAAQNVVARRAVEGMP